MRGLFLAILLGCVSFAGNALADERAQIAEKIVNAQILQASVELDKVTDLTAMAMGADRANLTADESKSLHASLRSLMVEIVHDGIVAQLNDRNKFSDSELDEIARMTASPTYLKWMGISKNMDFETPDAQAKIVTSLFKKIDPAVLAKLAVASRRKPI